jgi:hypothetical protein
MSKEAENITKIREILFGNNLTEFEKRFERSEQHYGEALSSLELQTSRQLAELRALAEENRQQQLALVQKEKESLVASILELKESQAILERKLNQTVTNFETALGETRQWIVDKTENLHQEQISLLNEYKKQVTELFAELQKSKVDRSAMAILFSEIALQLVDKKDHNDDAAGR